MSLIELLNCYRFTFSPYKCGKFEELMFKCAVQGSREQMYDRCAREVEDLHECLYEFKQVR